MSLSPPGKRPPFAVPMLLALAALAVISLAYGARTAARDSADLKRRATEARMFRERVDPYAVEDATYPPPALPVFAAVVWGSGGAMRMAWFGLNLLALVGVWGALAWRREGWPWWAILVFLLIVGACKPTRAGLGLGQFHLMPLAAICLGESLATRSPALSGICAGLALLKPTMSLPYLFVMAAKRRWKALAFAALTQLVLFAAASAWLGIGPAPLTKEWAANARSQLTYGTIDLPSLAGRAFPGWPWFMTGATVFVLVLSLRLIFTWRDRSALGLLAVSTFSAAVMTYHRHYDLVLLLPALAYLIDAAIRRGRGAAVYGAFLFGAALIVPSDKRFIGETAERIYDVAFVVLAYAILALTLFEVATERNDAAGGPGLT